MFSFFVVDLTDLFLYSDLTDPLFLSVIFFLLKIVDPLVSILLPSREHPYKIIMEVYPPSYCTAQTGLTDLISYRGHWVLTLSPIEGTVYYAAHTGEFLGHKSVAGHTVDKLHQDQTAHQTSNTNIRFHNVIYVAESQHKSTRITSEWCILVWRSRWRTQEIVYLPKMMNLPDWDIPQTGCKRKPNG